MSELIKSLEKSVAFLKERYPEDLPLLISLQNKLEILNAKKRKFPAAQNTPDEADSE